MKERKGNLIIIIASLMLTILFYLSYLLVEPKDSTLSGTEGQVHCSLVFFTNYKIRHILNEDASKQEKTFPISVSPLGTWYSI